MKITRRNFLLYSGAAALSATVVLPSKNVFGQSFKTEPLFPIPPESTDDALNYLRREHFEALVNTVFEFQSDDGRNSNLNLILVENLTLRANQKQGLTGDGFSLLFEGSKKAKIRQGVYQVKHDLLGKFSLFIVPVGLRVDRYEAIINRINA